MTQPIQSVFESLDHQFMGIALEKAIEALKSGDFPVGAALVVDGVCIDAESNSNVSDASWTSHAEQKLILRHSAQLKRSVRAGGARVELFSTMEPCLMCLGASVFSRVRRIVYAASDQIAGAARLDPKPLGDWYSVHWPLLQGGLLREECEMLFRNYRLLHPRPND